MWLAFTKLGLLPFLHLKTLVFNYVKVNQTIKFSFLDFLWDWLDRIMGIGLSLLDFVDWVGSCRDPFFLVLCLFCKLHVDLLSFNAILFLPVINFFFVSVSWFGLNQQYSHHIILLKR